MKVFADWDFDYDLFKENGFGGDFSLSFDDEKGHKLENVTIQPEISRAGEITDLRLSDSVDDLTLWKDSKEEKYYSETRKEFKDDDFKNILYFYEYDEDEEIYIIKEEVRENIYKAVNEEILMSLRWFINNENDKKSESPSILRARIFLQDTPFIVACNRYGKCASENFGWKLYGFEGYDEASKFYDEWEKKYYNGSEYLGFLTKENEEYIATLLEYHGIKAGEEEDYTEEDY